MNKDTIEKTQFIQVIDRLKGYAISSYGKQRIEELKPSSNLALVKNRLRETAEAKALLLANLHVPFMGLSNIEHLTNQVEKGFILDPHELIDYADFLRSGRLIQNFMEKNKSLSPLLANYSLAIQTFSDVEDDIYRTIRNNQIDTEASRELRKIRRSIQECEREIEEKLSKFLRSSGNKSKIQEFIIVKKNERFTVPIKATYKNQISGTIVDASSKGTTVFIEPAGVTKLNDKLYGLKLAERAEVYQIQSALTGMIAEQMTTVKLNIDIIAEYDAIFARGKYSRDIGGREPQVNKEGYTHFVNVKHTLLGKQAVPLNLTLGKDHHALTITGPNAGGKTVVLKTLGLITLQVMIGMEIMADEPTEIALYDQIFVDIGDQQSIENALSTFSGHMSNISAIMKEAQANSLILLDELGSGTEPNEGAALAIAIMEEFYQKGCTVVTTTHYGEIKRYSTLHPDFVTAAMAFDAATLSPRYQLIMGETGESNAFWIANKMALNEQVVAKAQSYLDNREYHLEKRTQRQPKQVVVAREVHESVPLSKGDRVLYLENGQQAIVFAEDEKRQTVVILSNEELVEVPKKRLKLEIPATQLYPSDYDLDSLFTSYHYRKEKRDLERGSKKAHKKLQKEMRARRKQQ